MWLAMLQDPFGQLLDSPSRGAHHLLDNALFWLRIDDLQLGHVKTFSHFIAQYPISGLDRVEYELNGRVCRHLARHGGVVDALEPIVPRRALLYVLSPEVRQRVLAAVRLRHAHSERLPAALDALDRRQRRAAVMVDCPVLRDEGDAVEGLRGEDEHARLLHPPLVARDHRPAAQRALPLADEPAHVLHRPSHRLCVAGDQQLRAMLLQQRRQLRHAAHPLQRG
eukprot:CAMPEP_0182820314 /NCGR_PEP_ID=MMETSP0006_2-20121128/13062_1 /TAXON_ID=97485 /ORGANISM="Prymnesium parvum, Strain Texoma1" /LENGTH=223 /DNA_ID=CAMNT_0024946979 /DNA_START=439 /DNA_END=1107 /DNA_ORIENTATION=-